MAKSRNHRKNGKKKKNEKPVYKKKPTPDQNTGSAIGGIAGFAGKGSVFRGNKVINTKLSSNDPNAKIGVFAGHAEDGVIFEDNSAENVEIVHQTDIDKFHKIKKELEDLLKDKVDFKDLMELLTLMEEEIKTPQYKALHNQFLERTAQYATVASLGLQLAQFAHITL